MKQYNLKIPPEMLARIEKEKELHGVSSVSAFIRMAITKLLNTNP